MCVCVCVRITMADGELSVCYKERGEVLIQLSNAVSVGIAGCIPLEEVWGTGHLYPPLTWACSLTALHFQGPVFRNSERSD